MSTIVTRSGKGSPLTHTEVDANFTNLNNGKLETSLTKAQLSTAVSDGDVLFVGDVTTNATHTGDVTGATALTIDPTAITGKTAVTAVGTDYVLISDTSDSGNLKKALVSDFGGSGGTPGGSSGEVQYNNGGAFAGAADVEIEGGQLRLPSISTPTAPATSGLKLFGQNQGNAPVPAYRGPLDVASQAMQTAIAEGNVGLWLPSSGTTLTVLGWPAATTGGTITAANLSTGSRRVRMKRVEYLVTAAATTAVAHWRINVSHYGIGGGNSWEGGFRAIMHGGVATGATNGSHRFFMGVSQAFAATDANPSTLQIMAGVAYDDTDTNVQFMHNDGAGTATKIDLGASFPKPNADRSFTYKLRLYSPPGTTQRLDYEVVYLETGAVATGSVTTNIPTTSDIMCPLAYTSVGGVSAVTGITLGPIYMQTEPY